MHIGLIGGIGPAATDYYYRGLISAMAEQGAELQLTMAHADTSVLLDNLMRDDKDAQVEIFTRLTKRLQAAGAECLSVTSIAGHFCIEELKAVSPLPVVDILQEVNSAIGNMELQKVGILGTSAVMETRFYGGINSAEVLAPAQDELANVHQAYVEMASSGKVTNSQRDVFFNACRNLIDDQGVQAIMLGGTDLMLAFDQKIYDYQVIDCAKIHMDAIAAIAAS